MHWRAHMIAGAIGFVAAAAPAFADDASDVRSEMKEMKARLEAQDRKIRELEGKAPTQDEVAQAVAAYVGSCPSAVLVGGGGGADGSAGFPLGKKPFIKEGPNKLEIAFRNQVRYEAFLYSKHAEGTLSDTGNPWSDNAPRDRSGFEIERLYIGFDGSIFCEDITYKLELNFDADSGSGVEKRYAYMDWKYSGEHHVRAGSDKTPYSYEEQNSSSALAFVDRSIVSKAFQLGFDTGVSLWGYFGDSCGECPKQAMYKFMVSNGEGKIDKGSVFNTDAFDTYSDNLLVSGEFEWTFTCKDWKWDEVDNRPCDKRCELNLSAGVAGYYEKDNDLKKDMYGELALRSSGRMDHYGLNAWVRGQWNGLSWVVEGYDRNVDYTRTTAGLKSTAPTQEDKGAYASVHYRFAESNWGIGVRAGIIWLDDDYKSITVGPTGNTHVVKFADTITEFGVVVNYFFWDHNNKISADVNWVQDNSGVNTSSAGYMFGASKGVVVEDGIMLRVQWQLSF